MVEAHILYEKLNESDEKEDVERTLVSLIHESFHDEYTTVSYFKSSEVVFEYEWVDAGRFILDDYTVERSSPGSYSVQLSCSYDELLPMDTADEEEEIDFFDTIEGHVVYKLTVQVGEKVHAGHGKIHVIPKV